MTARIAKSTHREGLPSALNATDCPTITRVGFAPIVRVDPDRREIELCATSEAVDAHGTVFAYAASRDAFARWAGNVREMHERKAVGRRVAVRCDDTARKVYVRVRISHGAEDTWRKVLDGTLRGASIGAANVVWRREPSRDGAGEDIPIATRYDLVELSLVDLPSNPDALGITLVRTLVRDGVPLASQLDDVDERDDEKLARLGFVQGNLGLEEVPDVAADPTESGTAQAIAAAALARGRAAVASESDVPGVHRTPRRERASEAAPGHTAKRARLAALGAPGYVAPDPAMNGQGTDGGVNAAETVHSPNRPPALQARDRPTARARGPFSANPDGPPDMGVPARASERPIPAGAPGGRPAADVAADRDDDDGHDRAAHLHGAARAILRACGCPACHTALAMLDEDDGGESDGADDGSDDGTENRLVTARFTRALRTRLDAHTQRLAGSIAAVHADVGQFGALLHTIERRVAAIEEQPMPGGPRLRVADKTHALLPSGGGAYGGAPAAGEQLRALEALAGRLSDPQAQIAVATEMIRLQQQAAGLAPDQQAMPRAGLGGY